MLTPDSIVCRVYAPLLSLSPVQEWDALAANPEKMGEMLASFKDPEVMEKAKEMLNDPE